MSLSEELELCKVKIDCLGLEPPDLLVSSRAIMDDKDDDDIQNEVTDNKSRVDCDAFYDLNSDNYEEFLPSLDDPEDWDLVIGTTSNNGEDAEPVDVVVRHQPDPDGDGRPGFVQGRRRKFVVQHLRSTNGGLCDDMANLCIIQ